MQRGPRVQGVGRIDTPRAGGQPLGRGIWLDYMIVIPIVDLRDGCCVEPFDGANATRDARRAPAPDAPREWAHAGFRHLQVVDLDAAAGVGVNDFVLDELLRETNVEVQVAGDVHSGDRLDQLILAGVSRVVVGTRALEEPDWLAGIAADHPGSVIVSTDVRERRVHTRGQIRILAVDILDLVAELAALPLGGLLVSATPSDGMRPTDLALLEDLAEASPFPIMTCGGVTTLNDLRALAHRGIAAAVIGQPLYSGALDPRAVAQEFGE
jgi:phosphoribosylformimino-5-aminoimidazole carboxamide ribonucleotide (ProFAR) isomerase